MPNAFPNNHDSSDPGAIPKKGFTATSAHSVIPVRMIVEPNSLNLNNIILKVINLKQKD